MARIALSVVAPRTLVAACATLASLATGCAAPMLSPVAPWIARANADWAAGVWISAGTSSQAAQGGIAAVEFQPDGRCTVQYRQTGGSGDVPVALDLEARVFEMKGRLFADVTLLKDTLKQISRTYACFVVPTHVLARIDKQADGSVTLALASYSEISKLATSQNTPVAARQYGDVEEVSMLTGDSESITKFFEANAANDDLFDLKMKFVRPK